MPTSEVKEGAVTSVYSEELHSAAGDDNQGGIYYVLEESSGYMEPSLHLMAVAHTLISFCCIIGYYCLKVNTSTNIPLIICRPTIYFNSHQAKWEKSKKGL